MFHPVFPHVHHLSRDSPSMMPCCILLFVFRVSDLFHLSSPRCECDASSRCELELCRTKIVTRDTKTVRLVRQHATMPTMKGEQTNARGMVSMKSGGDREHAIELDGKQTNSDKKNSRLDSTSMHTNAAKSSASANLLCIYLSLSLYVVSPLLHVCSRCRRVYYSFHDVTCACPCRLSLPRAPCCDESHGGMSPADRRSEPTKGGLVTDIAMPTGQYQPMCVSHAEGVGSPGRNECITLVRRTIQPPFESAPPMKLIQ